MVKEFLNNKDVRKMFQEEFSKPIFNKKKKTLLAPPLTTRYSRIGTAFDYLLRFYIKYLNPKAINRQWFAENSVILLKSVIELDNLIKNHKKIKNNKKFNLNIFLLLFKMFDNIEDRYEIKNHSQKIEIIRKCYQKTTKIISKAKKNYSSFLKNGQISEELIKSTLLLAQIDLIHRGYISKNLGNIDDKDVKDLRKLISLVDPMLFKAKDICLLSPTFGKASRIFGGSSTGDLVIDDILIDIKTTKNLQLNRDYFNQLICYYILYRIGGIDDMPLQNKIKKLGIYFSRHGYLHLIKVEDIIDENKFITFIEWFKERASKLFKERMVKRYGENEIIEKKSQMYKDFFKDI